MPSMRFARLIAVLVLLCVCTLPTFAVTAPAAIRQAGVIRFGADFTEAPGDYYSMVNHVRTGADYEICNAAAQRLGVKSEWVDLPFGGLIPALIAGRFDVSCSAMYVTPARNEVVGFVPYFRTGYSAAVLKANPRGVRSAADLCGLSVVETLGTVYRKLVEAQSQACVAAGKPAIDLKLFSTPAETVMQLLDQRADVWLSGDPLVEFYVRKQPQVLDIAFSGANPMPIAYAIAPNNPDLGRAFTAALAAMKADGSYQRILEKYGIKSGEVSSFTFLPVK